MKSFILILVTKKLSKISGSFDLKLATTTDTLTIADGKISIQGKPVDLFVSTNPKFPTSDGWFTMVRGNGAMALARMTTSAKKIEVKVIRGNEVLPAGIGKAGAKPPKQLPVEGKNGLVPGVIANSGADNGGDNGGGLGGKNGVVPAVIGNSGADNGGDNGGGVGGDNVIVPALTGIPEAKTSKEVFVEGETFLQ